ncbi:MAG: hypothetical protein PF636_10750 [Actinomycetota bacterium]|jgi:hypothetical protein|nr:hypothetical protein [Actinomycetota bacterium]
MRESECGEIDSVGHLIQALFLLTAAVLSGAVLSVPGPLGNLIGIFCMLALTVAVRSCAPIEPAGRAGQALTAAIVLGVAVASALLLVAQGSARMIVLVLLLCWLDLVERRSGSVRSWYSVAELSAILYGTYLLALEHVSWVAWGVSRAAEAFSWVAGLTTKGTVSVGPGYLGIDLLVLFALYVIVAARLSRGSRTAVRATALLGMLLAAGIVHAALWVHLTRIDALQSDGLLQPFVNAYDFRPLLFLVLLVLVSIQPPRISSPAGRTPFAVRKAVVVAVIVGLAWALLAWGGPIGDGDGRVLVLDSLKGANGEDVPVFDSYGLENAGQFGLLPGYVSARGYEVRVVEALADDDLGWADVLVIINLRDPLDAETTQSVWDFVYSGG